MVKLILAGAKPVPGARPYTPNPRIIGSNIEQAARDLGFGVSARDEDFFRAARELAGISSRNDHCTGELLCDERE